MKSFFLLLFLLSINLLANTYCSKDTIDQSISGKWQGNDSYYYNMSLDKKKHLCIEVKEDGQSTRRDIRDIYIENGILKAFLVYSPAMGSFSLTYDITFPMDSKMQTKWISSFGNMSGEEIIYKK